MLTKLQAVTPMMLTGYYKVVSGKSEFQHIRRLKPRERIRPGDLQLARNTYLGAVPVSIVNQRAETLDPVYIYREVASDRWESLTDIEYTKYAGFIIEIRDSRVNASLPLPGAWKRSLHENQVFITLGNDKREVINLSGHLVGTTDPGRKWINFSEHSNGPATYKTREHRIIGYNPELAKALAGIRSDDVLKLVEDATGSLADFCRSVSRYLSEKDEAQANSSEDVVDKSQLESLQEAINEIREIVGLDEDCKLRDVVDWVERIKHSRDLLKDTVSGFQSVPEEGTNKETSHYEIDESLKSALAEADAVYRQPQLSLWATFDEDNKLIGVARQGPTTVREPCVEYEFVRKDVADRWVANTDKKHEEEAEVSEFFYKKDRINFVKEMKHLDQQLQEVSRERDVWKEAYGKVCAARDSYRLENINEFDVRNYLETNVSSQKALLAIFREGDELTDDVIALRELPGTTITASRHSEDLVRALRYLFKCRSDERLIYVSLNKGGSLNARVAKSDVVERHLAKKQSSDHD